MGLIKNLDKASNKRLTKHSIIIQTTKYYEFYRIQKRRIISLYFYLQCYCNFVFNAILPYPWLLFTTTYTLPRFREEESQGSLWPTIGRTHGPVPDSANPSSWQNVLNPTRKSTAFLARFELGTICRTTSQLSTLALRAQLPRP